MSLARITALVIGLLAVPYLLFVFVTLKPNPFEWFILVRFVFIIIEIWVGVFIFNSIHQAYKESKDNNATHQ
jgi:hypothetical protein